MLTVDLLGLGDASPAAGPDATATTPAQTPAGQLNQSGLKAMEAATLPNAGMDSSSPGTVAPATATTSPKATAEADTAQDKAGKDSKPAKPHDAECRPGEPCRRNIK